jgi:hypothetical protein
MRDFNQSRMLAPIKKGGANIIARRFPKKPIDVQNGTFCPVTTCPERGWGEESE